MTKQFSILSFMAIIIIWSTIDTASIRPHASSPGTRPCNSNNVDNDTICPFSPFSEDYTAPRTTSIPFAPDIFSTDFASDNTQPDNQCSFIEDFDDETELMQPATRTPLFSRDQQIIRTARLKFRRHQAMCGRQLIWHDWIKKYMERYALGLTKACIQHLEEKNTPPYDWTPQSIQDQALRIARGITDNIDAISDALDEGIKTLNRRAQT